MAQGIQFHDYRRISNATLRVGLLGCGVVGTEVARGLLAPQGGALGDRLDLAQVAVLHPEKPRTVEIDQAVITGAAWEVVSDPSIDVVIEAIGGIDPALHLAREALTSRKHVVTANKELVARHGTELLELARVQGVRFLFEAAVGGAVPIIRTLRTSIASGSVQCVRGILNGTTNYVLDKVQCDGWSLDDGLRKARKLGYAEAGDDTDLAGWDAAFKLSILCGLAFDHWISPDEIPRDELDERVDLHPAPGRVLKQIGHATLGPDGLIVAVKLVEVSRRSPLSQVDGVNNGILLRCIGGEDLFFGGPGAGGAATATSIFADLLEVVRVEAAATNVGDHHMAPLPVLARELRNSEPAGSCV